MNIDTFEPMSDRILVRRHELKERSSGGIVIPDNAKTKATEGTILAIGPGEMSSHGILLPMHLAVGDVILFGKYAGSEMELGDDTVILMRETEVLGRTTKAARSEPKAAAAGSVGPKAPTGAKSSKSVK